MENSRCYEDRYQPCMIMGATVTASAIANSLVTYHGPGGCRMTIEHMRSDNIPTGVYNMVLSSGIDQGDVVYGGDEKLRQMLRNAGSMAKREGAEVIWLFAACAASMIDDDIEFAAVQAEEEMGIKVIAIDTPGFMGGFNTGAQKVYRAVLDHYVDPVQERKPRAGVINLVGTHLMGSKTWLWDYQEMVRLLERAGIETNIVFAHKMSLSKVKERYFDAQANYVLTSEEMPDFEEKCAELNTPIWGQDLVLPVGIANTEEWYLKIADRFGDVGKAKKQLGEDMKLLKDRLRRDYNASWILHDASGKHVAIIGYAPFAAALARMCLYDLNIRPSLIGLLAETPRALQNAQNLLGEVKSAVHPVIMENPTYLEWGQKLKEAKVDFAIGQRQDLTLTEGVGIPHLSLGAFYFMNHFSFIPWPNFGMKGFLGLLSEISRVMEKVKYETNAWKALSYIK